MIIHSVVTVMSLPLQESVFQIITANSDANAVFEEAVDLSLRINELNDGSTLSVQDCLAASCKHLGFRGNKTSKADHLTVPFIVERIVELAKQWQLSKNTGHSQLVAEHLSVCRRFIKTSVLQGSFLPDLFSSILSKHHLPIEMIWELHMVGAIQLQDFISSQIQEGVSSTTWIAQSLLSLTVVSEVEHKRNHCLLSGFMSVLVTSSFGAGTYSKPKDKVFFELLQKVLQGTMGMAPCSGHKIISPFDGIIEETCQSMQRFSQYAVSVFMFHEGTEILESFQLQSQWTPSAIQEHLQKVFIQLLKLLSQREALEVLTNNLQKTKVNSKALLHFLSAYFVVFEGAKNDLIDYARTNIVKSIQSQEANLLAAVFLVVRQCCSVHTCLFPTYRDWFQQTFEERQSPVSSRAFFSFFVKIVTSWVPYESAECLQAHILRRPHIPAKMKIVYEDYITLAKTRLSDLKVPLTNLKNELYSTHEDKKNQMNFEQSKKDTADEDVDKAVQGFEASGKIPTSVLEASIFKKPYYVGKFLPTLLRPRCLPDVADSKMKLIQEMKKSGHIPVTLSTRYEEGCQKESQMLLEGVFDSSDEEDLDLCPTEQLLSGFKKFKSLMLSSNPKDNNEITQAVVKVAEKLNVLVPHISWPHEEDTVLIDLNKPVEKMKKEVIKKMLICMSEVLSGIAKNCDDGSRIQNLQWLEQMMKAVNENSVFRNSLATYIAFSIHKKVLPEGITAMCVGMLCAVLMCQTGSTKYNVLHCTSHNETTSSGPMEVTLVSAVFGFLTVNTDADMLFSLRLWTSYVENAMLHLKSLEEKMEAQDVFEVPSYSVPKAELIPQFIVKQLILLSKRMNLQKKEESVMAVAAHLTEEEIRKKPPFSLHQNGEFLKKQLRSPWKIGLTLKSKWIPPWTFCLKASGSLSFGTQ